MVLLFAAALQQADSRPHGHAEAQQTIIDTPPGRRPAHFALAAAGTATKPRRALLTISSIADHLGHVRTPVQLTRFCQWYLARYQMAGKRCVSGSQKLAVLGVRLPADLETLSSRSASVRSMSLLRRPTFSTFLHEATSDASCKISVCC